MPELISQNEAEILTHLSAWILAEQRFLEMLSDAGCSLDEGRFCMSAEVN
jgi:hypothetical protein